MRYFSIREITIGIAGTLWICLGIWFAFFSDKTLGDVLVNLITDILFAFFVVSFIEYVNRRDQNLRNRSRKRSVALSVQKFYQNIVSIFQALVLDGFESTGLKELPAVELVVNAAYKFNSRTYVSKDFCETPVPYAAYFICNFTGMNEARVYPSRSSDQWIQQLARSTIELYRDVFFLDGGFLPDEVIDSLTSLKDQNMIDLFRNIGGMKPIRIGYWTEDELNTVVFHLSVLQRFFCGSAAIE